MRIREIIIESYPLAKKEFSQMAKPDVVQATIDQYRELVRKNQFRNPEEKNINHWRRLGWEAFSQMVKVKSNDVTDTQMKKGKVLGEIITLQDDDEWIILIPLDKEASVHYGKYTEWCTTKPTRTFFEDYVYEQDITLIYAIDKTKSGRSVAISITPQGAVEKIEMFNQNDTGINATKYKEISGLDPDKFIQMSKLPENRQQRDASIKKYKEARAKTAELLNTSPLDPEAIERELKFTKNQFDCYNYIMNYSIEQKSRIKVHPSVVVAVSTHFTSRRNTQDNAGQYIDFSNIPVGVLRSILRTTLRFIIYNADALSPNQKIIIKEYETSIKDDPRKSYKYAEITKKRFPTGEHVIATDAYCSYLYANTFFKDVGWPAGEAAIATSAQDSYKYAEEFGGKLPDDRLVAIEAGIATDAEYSYKYASDVLNYNLFPAGEPAMLENGIVCSDYTTYILANHRSPSWEQLIKDDSKKSLDYARARNEPFPAGEPAILSSKEHTQEYYKRILKNHRSPSWEQLIKDDPEQSLRYATERNEPFPAGELAIASDIQTSIQYIMKFAAKSSTWENVIKDNPEVAYFYAFILKKRFPAGEAAIATSPELATSYDSEFGTNLARP